MLAQLPQCYSPRSEHRFMERFDKRKQMGALVFSDLRNRSMCLDLRVFDAYRPQQSCE